MGNYGIKVSVAGKDITSTEPRDYIFNYIYGSVKVVQEPPSKSYQTITVAGGASGTATVTHNLGFIPLCLVYTELNPGSGRFYYGPAIAGSEDTGSQIFVNSVQDGSYADSNNLYIVYNNTSGVSKTIKYYYFIFGDPGS